MQGFYHANPSLLSWRRSFIPRNKLSSSKISHFSAFLQCEFRIHEFPPVPFSHFPRFFPISAVHLGKGKSKPTHLGKGIIATNTELYLSSFCSKSRIYSGFLQLKMNKEWVHLNRTTNEYLIGRRAFISNALENKGTLFFSYMVEHQSQNDPFYLNFWCMSIGKYR